jgi:hypothetical protein
MKATVWKTEHDEKLRSVIGEGRTFTLAAFAINEQFGTNYSRNACISRGGRLGLCSPKKKLSSPRAVMSRQQRSKILGEVRKAKRWAANPSLAYRAQRIEERKQYRVSMVVRGFSKTSPGYRKQLPRIGDVSKSALRSMLSTAVQNTADLGDFT